MPSATRRRARPIPGISSFVSANAGSGKTHVLVQRVIRLLLAGVPPEKILCITFTKAAAANMAERVFTTLGHWVTLDDAALDAAIRDVGIPHPTATLRKAARELFASRAGDAGRAEGADHPRAVHAPAAAVPVRGQRAGALCRAGRPRPDRDDGARQSQGVAGCRARRPTAPSAARCRPRWRAPPTSLSRKWCARPASAAIISWPGPTRPAARRLQPRRCRPCLASARQTGSRTSSAKLSMAPTCRARDGRRSPLRSRAAARPMQDKRTACARHWQPPAARRSTIYLGVFLTDDEDAAQDGRRPRNFVTHNPSVARLFEAEARRLGPLIEKRRAVIDARPHRGAAAHRDLGRRELPAREAGARAARL